MEFLLEARLRRLQKYCMAMQAVIQSDILDVDFGVFWNGQIRRNKHQWQLMALLRGIWPTGKTRDDPGIYPLDISMHLIDYFRTVRKAEGVKHETDEEGLIPLLNLV
ncbi:MAG: hypothetical protein B7Y12_04250 [Rhizobiales bacterium 24-66-13]|nr:MAG: hypothetical protein B7Y61_03005 [Rhizobiales bacterium 35-66-30]OYZ82263.1 MAG: hypothetical protein B7Y12_04250 [Rhizobiales bacterium 24-66-13]OZB11106.1 MAG: hypothetical protein B7X67_05275 [Rhizobiales bacterium 39-66-18]